MRKLTFLFMLMGLMVCSCSSRSFSRNGIIAIEPSDSVAAMLGDSVCNVIFNAPEVDIYSVAQPGDTSSVKTEFVFKHLRTIVEESDSLSVSVDSLYCDTLAFAAPEKLNCSQKAVLRFVLSGEKMYMAGENWPSAPFIPDYMLQFSDKEHSVQIVISLSGGMFKIYNDYNRVAYVKYSDEYQMMRFLSLVTDDPFLKELLKLKENSMN